MRTVAMGVSTLPAASNQSRRNRRRIVSLPILAAILLLIFVQFSIVPQLFTRNSLVSERLSDFYLDRLKTGLEKCAEIKLPHVQYEFPASSTRTNPRWNPSSGQNGTVILRNVTLFDGESILDGPVDVTFAHGIIKSISPLSETAAQGIDVQILDLAGSYVTPGLVDMHSHHLVGSWPSSSVSDDTNEVNIPAFGPLTPFVRALDSIKPYDIATRIIASGGITSSLILPGSANIMGGEGFMVKNFMNGGEHREEVVEDLLLEHGVPQSNRRRYMKMACGENPKGVYGHTRMGNAWILRKHMSRAKELMKKQDQWCLLAEAALESGDGLTIAEVVKNDSGTEGLPEELELDSSVAMLRGKIGVNIHCYEPEDFEDMILHSKEFGFRIQAFHHALSAWKVPEMIKDSGYNITIATFAEFGLYKQEGYEANLWAGKILAKHGVPVAYKSDHGEEETNAKYLMQQAAVAHSFHLAEHLALQSVTSVPAKSLELDHRIGYVRPGYDADIVIWNSHPLRSIGSTPLQVFIDGRPTLDPRKVAETLPPLKGKIYNQVEKPIMRTQLEPAVKEDICRALMANAGKSVTITGIKKSFLELPADEFSSEGDLTMVLEGGKFVCLGSKITCVSPNRQGVVINLENGHVVPGFTALSSVLGLAEITGVEETKDGTVSKSVDPLSADNVVHAKYGVHLDGKSFKRARIGGVTRAITAPITDTELLGGLSVGIKTSGKKTILDGAYFKEDVALHFIIGQEDKGSDSTPTISSAIMKLRMIIAENDGKDSVYGQAANGTIPVVVHAESKYDILQLIKIKQDYEKVNIVINGGAGAPAVADQLAAAKIPVILSPFRSAPWQWQNMDCLFGPPLTKSSAQVLAEAGVTFGIAMGGETDSHIQSLALEASWAAKYAGLSERAAIDLVSRNIEKIMGIDAKEENRDIVVFEGNPLEYGASVVLSLDGDDKSVMDCWPEAE